MTVYAKRYHWAEVSPLATTALLDEFTRHPEFWTYPMTPDEARVSLAQALTNPANIIWASYSDQEFTGAIMLTRVVPRVNALLHFMFVDHDLAGKRTLLKNLITHCFQDLGFHRLTMEVPDTPQTTRLERFARRVLGFRLEGENRPRNPELPKALTDSWVAKQGSRRQESYFDGTSWSDILVLRILAHEWGGGEDVRGGDECPGKRSHPLQPPSLADSPVASSAAAAPVTPNPSSPRISSPSDSRTSGSSSTC